MFANLIAPVQNYYNALPDNTFSCVGRSAVFSFVASVILGQAGSIRFFRLTLQDFRSPLIAASCASVASLIHALMTPLFNQIFEDNDQNKLHRELLKVIVNMSLFRIVQLNVVGNVEGIAGHVALLPLNLFKSIFFTTADFVDWMMPVAPPLTQVCHYLGLNTAPDSSSTYLFSIS